MLNTDMGYEFKSDEEKQFADWLEEAKVHGLVSSWEYEPITFDLIPAKCYSESVQTKTKIKIVEKSLLNDLKYTPDFRVELTDTGLKLLTQTFKKSICTAENPHIMWVDTKGEFARNDGNRSFSIIQKVFYDTHKIYAEKVIPKKLFEKTFAPESVRWMKSRKLPTKTKIGTKTVTITEFLKEIKV
jgi:hypothetical protein